MSKPRIIIADTDINYILPLQLKFVEEFFDKADIEIITDENYYDEFISNPQKADVFIVSENLYDISLQRHNIGHIFLMTEQHEEDVTGDLNVDRIFKYSSIKEILNEILSKSSNFLKVSNSNKKETQIIVVYSACGGVGKTTVATSISAALTKNFKRVLYINASHFQNFQWMLDNQSAITTSEVYSKLTGIGENTYNEIKHVIRKELFYYLPPFKAALMSLGFDYSVFEKIALGAKKSGDYDYIIIDADTTFDEDKASLINFGDKVIVVTNQTFASVYATNNLVLNINGSADDKYIFICNNFDKESDNALISPGIVLNFSVSDYIDHIFHYDKRNIDDFSKEGSIQRVTFLIM